MNIERKIYINNDLDVVMARIQAREMAKQIGFGTADQARISLATSELAQLLAWTNPPQPGELILSSATKNGHQGMQVVCLLPFDPSSSSHDRGEADKLPKRNYTLTGASRLVDESLLEPCNEKLTRVTLRKWLIQNK